MEGVAEGGCRSGVTSAVGVPLTLDAAGRLAASTTESNSSGTWTQTAAKTNHYGADGDSPDWIQETSTTLTRNVQGPDGSLDATTTGTSLTLSAILELAGAAA